MPEITNEPCTWSVAVAKEQIGQHIGECHKHPMRIVEADRDAARHNKLELVLRGPGMVKEVWSR